MKSLFRTLLALLTLFAAQDSRAQSYFDYMAMEGVDFVGAVTYGKIDSYTTMETGYYSFSHDNKYQANQGTALLPGMVSGGCTYHDGKVYACEYDDGKNLSAQKPIWRIYDAKTFDLLSEHELEANCVSTTLSLAYDPTTDKIYGINRSYTETYLVSIDPETGTPTKIGATFPNADENNNAYRYAALGCDKKGMLYMLYMRHVNDDQGIQTEEWYLTKLRKSDAKFAKVGPIQMNNLLDGDTYINDTRDQALFCNFNTGKLYWIFPSTSSYLYHEYTCIAELDPTTATGSMVAYVPQTMLVSGAFFREPADKAPAVISDFQFVPDTEGATCGKMQMRLPATAYDGTGLTGTVHVSVVEDGDTLVSADAEAGSLFTSDELDLDNGSYTVGITVSGEGGDGPTVKRTFFVGYDVPTACTNITLTADGLTTTLTWDAPAVGQNGAPLDQDNLTYTVVRYPYEVTVASGIKERTFSEEHPGDMTRYVYMVTASDGSKTGKSAYSNNLIVGTPLDVPYGGPFTGVADMVNYYTIIDANKDGRQWQYYGSTNSAIYQYSETNAADDWLISPPVNYKKGHTYVLGFEAHSALLDYPETMEVCFGKERTPEAMDSCMLYIEEVPVPFSQNDKNTYELEFSVPEDGVYYYGFHVVTPAYHGNLFVSDISVRDKDEPTGIGRTVAGAAACVLSDGVLTVPAGTGVYDLSGHELLDAPSREASVRLAKGVYVVKSGAFSRKLVVR